MMILHHLGNIFGTFSNYLKQIVGFEEAMKKHLGWLGYIGDDILPSFTGIGFLSSHDRRETKSLRKTEAV